VNGAAIRRASIDVGSGNPEPQGAAPPQRRSPGRVRKRVAENQVLLRALRDLLRDATPHLPPADEDEEAVLSVEYEGVLYRLTQKRLPRPAVAHSVSLSTREQEIARMIAAGHTNRTVAAVLDISSWTVDTHLRRIFAKLRVRSRSAMIARLADEGLLGMVDEL
jgi:DNA-binding CsgD family transcriptional regulator